MSRNADDRAAAHRLPGLLLDFWSFFASQLVDAGTGIRLYAISGVRGLLVLVFNGWLLTWHSSRHLMSILANDFHIIVLERRGVGLSAKLTDPYDGGTFVCGAVGAMVALGRDRFFVPGEDVGVWMDYAVAADFPDMAERYVHAETIKYDLGLFGRGGR